MAAPLAQMWHHMSYKIVPINNRTKRKLESGHLKFDNTIDFRQEEIETQYVIQIIHEPYTCGAFVCSLSYILNFPSPNLYSFYTGIRLFI